ncbi:MAG: hypothetical protein ACLQVN_12835 [Bryobacteraceae bacterium]
MTCQRCRKTIDADEARCPYCGLANADANGLYQTSVVRIAAGAADLVYRSVDEVPAPLRQKLLASTNSPNSATILIADRRGRKEIAKAVRSLPGSGNRRLYRSLLPGADPERVPSWFTRGRRNATLIALGILLASLVAFVFRHRW